MKIIVAITGASGAIYAVRFIHALRRAGHEVHVIISETAVRILNMETGKNAKDAIAPYTDRIFHNNDLFAPPASGTAAYAAMVVVPCSISTLGKIAAGIGDNLICRAASVMMKEHKKLVLVPRETPLAAVHLENMAKLAARGVIILPACPAFYHKPRKIEDLVDYVVMKMLDVVGVEGNTGTKRWGE